MSPLAHMQEFLEGGGDGGSGGGLVTKLCPTLHDLMLTVHGLLQARILESVAIPFPRESSLPSDRTWIFCIAGGFFTI